MTNEAEFDAIDEQIEALHERLESCRKSMALSRVAVGISLVTLVLLVTVTGFWRAPVVMLSAITGAIGGLVWLGASRTSRDETTEGLAALDRSKARLIDEIAARNGWRDTPPTLQ